MEHLHPLPTPGGNARASLKAHRRVAHLLQALDPDPGRKRPGLIEGAPRLPRGGPRADADPGRKRPGLIEGRAP